MPTEMPLIRFPTTSIRFQSILFHILSPFNGNYCRHLFTAIARLWRIVRVICLWIYNILFWRLEFNWPNKQLPFSVSVCFVHSLQSRNWAALYMCGYSPPKSVYHWTIYKFESNVYEVYEYTWMNTNIVYSSAPLNILDCTRCIGNLQIL